MQSVKNIALAATAAMIVSGCGDSDVKGGDIDLTGVAKVEAPTIEKCEELYPTIGYTPNSDLFKNILNANLSPSIAPGSIQMNHYIAEVMTSETFNPVIDYYLGNANTKASLVLDPGATSSSPVEHIIVIKFMQDGPPPADI